MKRSLIFAALLGTTMLTPRPAEAMPQVIPFIVGAAGTSAATAGAIGIATGAGTAFAAGAAFATTVIGGFIVKTVVAVGLSALAAKLSERSVSQPPPSSQMVNFAQPISYAEHVYGRTRKGGPLGFTGFASSRRYYIPILAAHPIEGVVEHWIDDRVVEINSEADKSVSNLATAPFINKGRIDVMDGGPSQVANPAFVSEFAEFTSAFDFKGLAVAHLWCRRVGNQEFSTVYKRGREWAYAPVLDGNNQIYDPRDDSTGYSNNAALVIADWQVNVVGNTVNWDRVAVEADVADTIVTNAESETQPLWALNGTVNDSQEFEEQRAQMATACDAFMFDSTDGHADFYLGRWMEPTVTLTLADFWSHELTTGGWGGNVPDEVASVYTEPENSWRETPSGTWVHTASTKPVRDDPRLYMCTNHNQATRVNRRLARMKNAEWRLQGTLKASGYELLGQRFFRFVNEEMGIDQYFEVGELARESVGQFSLSANSVEPEDFAEAITEPTRPTYDVVTSSNDVDDITGLEVTQVAPGTLEASWDDQDESLTQQIRYKLDSDTDWQIITVPEGQSYLRITGLSVEGTYETEGRNRTGALRTGNWVHAATDAEVLASVTPPVALTSFTGSMSGESALLQFTPPNDPNYAATELYHSATTTFGDATKIATRYGAPATATTYTDFSPGIGDHYYWAIPINASSVQGPTSGHVAVSIISP